MKRLFVLPTYLCLASLSLADDATSKAAPADVAKPGLSPASQNLSSQSGPIRVLFLGTEGGGSRKHAHTVMRDFGRDALWFDYTADPAQVSPEWVAKFDAVLLDAPAATFPALSAVPPEKVVTADFSASNGNPAPEGFLNPLK